MPVKQLPAVLLAVAAVLALVFVVTGTTGAHALTAEDRQAIEATALDYVDGWYTGDAARMRRALHPELAKRIVRTGEGGASRLDSMTAAELVDMAGKGYGTRTPEADRQRDVEILDVYGGIAMVKATMSGWVDYMHVARFDGRWVIVNVLWEMKPSAGS